MDMIQFIQKARQLKVLGFDSYQGIIATHGIDTADQILSYLLEASELGFNLDDLKTLFNNLSGNSIKKEEIVPQEPILVVEEKTTETDLWSLVKDRFGIDFDVEKFALEYANPSFPQCLEIEDFLMCLGVEWYSARSRMRGASGTISAFLVGKGYNRKSYPVLTTISSSSRLVFDKTKDTTNYLLESLRKFLLVECDVPVERKMTLREWLDFRLPIEREGQIEQWHLPEEVYIDLAKGVNNLLIKYNIDSKYLSKTHTTKDIASFTFVDALDVGKGFCEIIYRDVVTTYYNRDISFREIVQEFCTKKGIVYTKEFEDLVLEEANKIVISQYEFKKFILKSVRPFHQLVLFHLLEKLNSERNALKVGTLFS
jgi:hypothetical protein